MKEVGDKFGAGELILPFVLQSAEVMKRAVAQLEKYLDKLEGYTKGTVVLATVFGDVHDIGKSLVNTILTNNGYTVVDLGKQVPIQTILDAAKEHKATAIGLSALLVSTSKQMPLAVQELHQQGLDYPVLLGGAAINRKFALRALYPGGKESRDVYDPGVFYCKDAFEGLAVMDRLIESDRRAELVEEVREAAKRLREVGEEEEVLDTTDDSVRSPVRTDVEVPEPPFWGVREIEVDREELYTHLDTHVLFKLHWGGSGVKGEEWKRLLDEDFRPRLERMWREADYLHPRALLGYFPCYSEGNDIVVLDPEDRETVIERFTCPRQPKGDRLCLADFYRPKDSGELDVVALQAVTVGSEVTELMARLEADGEFAEQLFVHGLGVQTAEGLAEWLHWRVRNDLGIDVRQGRRYSWGYPAVPDQSEHLKVEKLLDLQQIGMEISDGYAPIPEQSTLALVCHHHQAGYYGMRNGRLLPDGSPDDVIRGTAARPLDVRGRRGAGRLAPSRGHEGAGDRRRRIRGLIPALVLAEIERRTGRAMATMVDLIAGTSTGGIIACALAKPDPMPAVEIAALYETDGPKIFDRSALQVITSANGYLDERYDSAGLVEVLERHLGDARLTDATTPVLLTVYDLEARQALLLRSDDITMVDAAHATSAAPTYFEPVRLGARTLIDGGVFAINPAVFAYAEAPPELLLSLGTGSHTRRLPYDDVKDWGRLEWAEPIIDVVFDGSADAVDAQLQALAGDRYVRLQTRLIEASDDLDDASAENLAALRREAERLIAERDADIDRVCEILV